jgi:hypothetical protein
MLHIIDVLCYTQHCIIIHYIRDITNQIVIYACFDYKATSPHQLRNVIRERERGRFQGYIYNFSNTYLISL